QQDRLAEIYHRKLHVRGLAIVRSVVREPHTQAIDLRGQRAALDAPAGNVHLVHALVADLAVAKVPEPMPSVGMQVGLKRLHGSRADPHVVIEIRGRRGKWANANAGSARLASAALAGAAAADE